MLCQGAAWTTDEPLGIGALLISAYRPAAMIVDHAVKGGQELLEQIVAAAEVGLAAYTRGVSERVNKNETPRSRV